MHSLWVRVTEIFSLALVGCFTGVVLLVCSSVVVSQFPAPKPIITDFGVAISPLVQTHLPLVFAQGEYPPPMQDVLLVSVSFTADFSKLWDWNTKHMYVACIARYTTRSNTTVGGVNVPTTHDVTIYDKVLSSKEEAKNLTLKNARKYALESEQLGALAGRKVELLLLYQPIRHYGYSPYYVMQPREGPVVFQLPTEYEKRTEEDDKNAMCSNGYV
uniref:Signal peptidase complex subunit 3 n=1 Tax=Trypanosoma congolense (strain IL3000) TaxID=1068625 RepID=G0UMR3_TRYCI|nr:conserved hypothetical protein [Trypanosoma congolense IL3000]